MIHTGLDVTITFEVEAHSHPLHGGINLLDVVREKIATMGNLAHAATRRFLTPGRAGMEARFFSPDHEA
jgi:hypothetical protein